MPTDTTSGKPAAFTAPATAAPAAALRPGPQPNATPRPAPRLLVVDDEELITKALARYLGSRGYEVETAGSGEAALETLGRSQFSLMICDVRMPGLSGLEVVPRARQIDGDLAIMMLTGVNDAPTATGALATGALDYLLKPVTPARFREALDRARERLSAPSVPKARPLVRLLVRDDTKAFLLALDRVDRIEADGNYVRLHSAGKSFTVRMAIGALASRLDCDKFLRISRSAIVRLDAIKELHPWFHGDYHVVMTDGARLTWTRRYRAAAMPELGGSAS